MSDQPHKSIRAYFRLQDIIQPLFDEENLIRTSTSQLTDALVIRPPLVMNGSDSSLVKSHLESIGFDLLRVRANLVEIRDVLQK